MVHYPSHDLNYRLQVHYLKRLPSYVTLSLDHSMYTQEICKHKASFKPAVVAEWSNLRHNSSQLLYLLLNELVLLL